MEIINGLNKLREKFRNSVVTIGSFDGVHRGHARLIQKVVKENRRLKTTSLVLCFDPPPRVVFKKNPLCLLTGFDQKKELIQQLGPDALLRLRFNHRFALMPAEKFIQKILSEKLQIKKIIVGWNFRFGNQRRGNVNTLKKLGEYYKFGVQTMRPLRLKKDIITSSRIRKLIEQGKVEEARRLLGHPFSIPGKVTGGSQRGRKLHFPTANLKCNPQMILPRGVFAVYIKVDKQLHPGLCNIGVRPTFSPEARPVVEVNIFNFTRNIYGQQMEIFFVKKLREEKKFANHSLLVARIKKDYQQAKKILQPQITRI